MGEKGIAADAVGASVGVAGASIIERTTTQVTSSVIGVVEDTGDSIRSKMVEAVADNAVEEGRERLRKDPPPEPVT